MAIIFVIGVFYFKNRHVYENTLKDSAGLVYGEQKLTDVMAKDSDGDGVPDWQENLMGTDPNKKETIPGVPDSVTIAKKRESGGATISEENLTETDKFSRGLFSTVASLSQVGPLSTDAASNISSSLFEQIKNYTVKKVYTNADINISKDDSIQAVKSYNTNLTKILNKYQTTANALDIFAKFAAGGDNPDGTILNELNPIIKQKQNILDQMLKLSTPPSLAQAHLDLMNGLERIKENLVDVKLFDTDPIISLGAISQFEKNLKLFGTAVDNLSKAIQSKLKS